MGSILVLGGAGFTVKEVVETARKVTEHPIPAPIIALYNCCKI